MVLFLVSVLVALVVSFLCSLAEAVLLSLNSTRLETQRAQGKLYAEVWLDMKRHVDRPIAGILILNTVAHTGGATVAGSAFDDIFGNEWIWVFSLVFTVAVLLGTEIAPKVIGVAYAHRLAPVLAGPLVWMTRIFTPLLALTEAFSRMFKPQGAATGEEDATEAADLVTLARLARAKSLIEPDQERIIVNAAKMREMRVRDGMIPVEEIVLFDIRKSTTENLDLARQTLHTRYPVTETGEPDGVVGFVNLKEIFAVAPEQRHPTLEPYLRGVVFIDPQLRLSQALQMLTSRRQHIAMVRDPAKRVIGMLTMEDLLQEIVGDYEDELDVLPRDLIKLGEGRWRIGSGVELATVRSTTGFAPGGPEARMFVGGWVAGVLPHPLRQGAVFQTGEWKVTLQMLRRGEPHQLLVERVPPPGAPGN